MKSPKGKRTALIEELESLRDQLDDAQDTDSAGSIAASSHHPKQPADQAQALHDATIRAEQALTALSEKEARYRTLVQNLPGIVYRCALDADGTMEYISDFVENVTGYPAADFIKNKTRSYASIIHPDDRAFVTQTVKEGVSNNGFFSIEYRLIDKNNAIRWVFERGQVIRKNNDNLDHLDGVIMDISELKEAEKLLEAKNALINAIQRLQSGFIQNYDLFGLCKVLLNDFLKLTGSEYGLIGELETTSRGKSYITTFAVHMPDWSQDSPLSHEQSDGTGYEFHELDNLFGYAITSGKAVISNDPAHHPAAVGLPEGHPPIRSFMGIPVYHGDRIVGQIALANRQGGYTEEIQDYISPLVSAYGQIIIARQEQLARAIAEEKLARLAKLDGLLGIPNRRSFDEFIEKAWSRGRRKKEPLSVMMIDIDHFKLYNDHYGHQQGDKCLKTVAAILTRCIRRPTDMLARYGGEEFVCVLPDTPLEGAMAVAETMQKKIARKGIPHESSKVAKHVTLSLGIATITPAAKESSINLIRHADQLLYQAKKDGRNRIVNSETE